MAKRKKTLRQKPEMTRKYLRLLNELESVLRRLKNMEYDIQDAEMCRDALQAMGVDDADKRDEGHERAQQESREVNSGGL